MSTVQDDLNLHQAVTYLNCVKHWLCHHDLSYNSGVKIMFVILKINEHGTTWFWIVQYLDPADAADAKYHTDGYVLGPELTVAFAEENRKKPSKMRERERRSIEGFRKTRFLFVKIGTPRFIILNHRDRTEVSPAVQIIIVLLGKGITQEMGDIEGDPTQGRLIVGAGVKVWTILEFLPGFDVAQYHS
ncbi:hypothetical protein GOBAR_DD18641 [Gossypium barbadense]|nr:hypothetical protein GOBAR_DD18641 [Gossypium barbadense]